jgi:uncharacterized membrane protein
MVMHNNKWYRGDTIPGLVIALFGYTVVVYTIIEPTFTWKAQTSDGVPGGGFFPILLGGLLGVLGTVLFIKGLLEKGSVSYFKIDLEAKRNLGRIIKTILSIMVFFVVWQSTKHIFPSFLPCVVLLCLTLNAIFGRPLKYNIIYTTVLTLFLYLSFIVGFSVQFNM